MFLTENLVRAKLQTPQQAAGNVAAFKTTFRLGEYAYVERESVGLRIYKNQGSDGAPPGNRRFAYYVDVRDIERLHAELKPRLDSLPRGHVHGPADKPYGQRELAIVAPDGNLIVFGQAIAPDARK